MSEAPPPPSLRDVARLAGVSLATASRALNPARSASPRSRARVLAAVSQLGYLGERRPAGPAQLVGVVVPGTGHQIVAEIVTGVDEATAEAGRFCAVTVSHADPRRELRLLADLLADDRVGGIILAGGFRLTSEYARDFVRLTKDARDRGRPVVLCGRAMTPEHELVVPGTTVLEYDNEGGAASAVELLASHGHRRIGLVRGPVGHSTSDARSQGFRRAMAQLQLPVDPALVRVCARFAVHGHATALGLLAGPRRPTAVFAECDELALGVLQAASEVGLRVPADLSVVGFDDQDSARTAVPALTTVRMPFAELGRRAARIALGLEPLATRIMVATRMVVRESVGPVPPTHH